MKMRFKPSILLFVLSLLLLAVAVLSAWQYFENPSRKSILECFSYIPVLQLTLVLLGLGTILSLLRRWRMGLGVFVLTLLYFAACGDYSTRVLSRGGVPSGVKFSVLAFNVRYFSFGIESVAKVINDANADVTLLSETTLTPGQARDFVRLLPGQGLYLTRPDETAIISRFPVLEFKEVMLPSHQASLQGKNILEQVMKNPHRSFSHAVIDKGGTKIHVLSFRMIAGRPANPSFEEKVRWASYVLDSQIQEADFFLEYIRSLKGPVVFGGDLNAPPSATVIRRLGQYGTDAWLATNLMGDLTFTTHMPHTRLDYVFSNGAVIPLRARKYTGLIASDHFPVYAEFVIPGGVAHALQ